MKVKIKKIDKVAAQITIEMDGEVIVFEGVSTKEELKAELMSIIKRRQIVHRHEMRVEKKNEAYDSGVSVDILTSFEELPGEAYGHGKNEPCGKSKDRRLVWLRRNYDKNFNNL